MTHNETSMMKKYIFCIVLLSAVFSIKSFDQIIPEFTQEGFVNELTEIFGKSKNKTNKLILESFNSAWNSGSYIQEEQESLLQIANILKIKKGRINPHLKNYLNCIIEFSGRTGNYNFSAWKTAFLGFEKNELIDIKDINELLLFTYSLLTDHSLNKNYAVNWKSDTEEISFFYTDKLGVNVGNGNLICISGRDSIVIYNTSGKYYPVNRIWEGTEGKVTWTRAGFDPENVFAKLRNYKISLVGPEYNIDTVNFIYNEYFDHPVPGSLFDKVKATRKPENATYPQFDSFDKKNRIRQLYPNVDFEGGFTLNGSRMMGSGDIRNDASLSWYVNNKLFFKAASKKINFDSTRAAGNNTIVKFYIGENDSIYHPGLQFVYSDLTREVNLVRDGRGKANSPYFNSYHEFDMYTELMTWPVDDSIIYLGTIKGSIEEKASFESSNYYTERRYADIQNLDIESPLFFIRECARTFGSNKFTINDLTIIMRKSIHQVRQILLNLSIGGFVSYSEGSGMIEVEQRTWDYLDNLSGKRDYDVISFTSITGQGNINAKIGLKDLTMTVYGVNQVKLSEAQNMFIYPFNNTVYIKRNRDIVFDGKVKTAFIDFSGRTFYFDYNGFKIKMDSIDYIKMKVPGKILNEKGQAVLQDISSIIENLSGTLYIDHPNNKSGFFYIPWYPVFKSDTTAYIYYDQKTEHAGAYPRDKVFFQIDSFAIDSLNSLDKQGVIRFPGSFITNVFPPIEAELTLQEDYSLGFELTKTPEEGYPVYGGKARFYNNISMSKKGLKGDGELHYITSVTKSNDFTFYPDSMKAKAQTFDVSPRKEEPEFPPVRGKNMYIQWFPGNNEFIASALRDSISFYNEAKLAGRLYLDSSGMKAKGILDFGDFELSSDNLLLANRSFDANPADFKIKTGNSGGGSGFQSDNINAHFDLDNRTGEFTPNSTSSAIIFPENNFKSSSGMYVYDMNNKTVQMKNTLFTSTDPARNNLSFTANSSDYDEINKTLITKGADSIVVGDIYIYPENGEIIIQDGGKLKNLKNAIIVINRPEHRHEIVNASVNIYGKNNYTAEGDYYYTDQASRKFIIHFNSIGMNAAGNTFAKGTIQVEDKFNLSPAFEFVGEAELKADRKFLTFKGSLKLIHDCPGISKNWVRFNSEVDPENPVIPVGRENLDINSNKLYSSIYLTNVNPEIYPSFLSVHKQISDIPVLSAEGFLIFDNDSQQFRISDMAKLEDLSRPGNLLTLNRQNFEVSGEGLINLGVDLGQVKLNAAGIISHKLIDKSTSSNIIMGVDFYFPDEALKQMANEIKTNPNLEVFDPGTSFYRKSLYELVGEETASNILGGGGLTAFNKLPDEIIHSIFFNDLKLSWNNQTSSYQAVDNIGIGNINGTPLNKKLKGYVEITKKRSGDILTIYFELNKNTWYFFQYTRGLMQSLSSDEKFNSEISGTKPEKQNQKLGPGQAAYRFFLSDRRTVDRYKEKFK